MPMLSPFMQYACEEAGIEPYTQPKYVFDTKIHIKQYVIRHAFMPHSMQRSFEIVLNNKNKKDDTLLHSDIAGCLIAKKKKVRFDCR